MKFYTKYQFCCLFSLILGACDTLNESRTIVIKGSETMQPLISALADKYNENQAKGIIFKIEGGGSQSGLDALFNDKTDIAMSSKSVLNEDQDTLMARSKSIKKLDIAIDEILIVVNSNNSVRKLTSNQLREIYNGEITSWDQVGGTGASIMPLSRKKGSGSLSFFLEKIMSNQSFTGSVMMMDNVKDILAKVENEPNAIAFVGGGHFSKQIKVLDISTDGVEYFYPSERNVRARYYPYVIPLSLYYVEDAENEYLNKFLKFVQTKSARYTITDMGFIPQVTEE
ncbi:MAG: PstS family phosphate ABC transporter substrate-binding protein [Cytophagales bacterium]